MFSSRRNSNIDTAAKTEFFDCKKKSSWDATEIQRAKVDV